MNALVVSSAAPAMSPFNTDEKRPPLGVGSLIAVAPAQGHRVDFIDNYLEPTDFIDANAHLAGYRKIANQSWALGPGMG